VEFRGWQGPFPNEIWEREETRDLILRRARDEGSYWARVCDEAFFYRGGLTGGVGALGSMKSELLFYGLSIFGWVGF
jgi:hypothetical protein